MVPNSTWTEASGVNDLGQVVGTYTDADGVAHGFMYQNGVYTVLDYPGMSHNYAFGINNDGAVVGSFSPVIPRGPYSASLRTSAGVWSAYDFPGHETDGRAINSAGHIVGIYNSGPGTPDHGFLKIGDNYTSIDYPGAPITFVMGINDAGLVTGTYRNTQGLVNGFVYVNGTYTSIAYPNATETIVTEINNANTIVGWKIEAGKTSGYVLNGARYRPVIVPFSGAANTKPRGINELGAIVGSYTAPDCPIGCSFLATPAPAATPTCDASTAMTYVNGVLTTDFTIRTNVFTSWTTWLVLDGLPFRLWALPVAPVNPQASVSVPIPVGPSLKNALLASFISTPTHGTICVDFATLTVGGGS
jgi:probable HAF family extracellular repeat protein